MVEGQPGEVDFAGLEGVDEGVEGDHGGDFGRTAGAPRGAQVRHHHRPLHRRQPFEDRRDARQRIVAPAAVAVAVGHEEEAGADLPETVDDALGAEVGRGSGEDGADRGGGEEDHHRLGHIGEQRGDPVTGADPGFAHGLGEARGEVVQLPPAHRPAPAVLGGGDDGRLVGAAAQEVLGEVEPRVREVAGAVHSVALDEDPLALVADDAAPVPHRAPEQLLLLDRPAPEGVVAAGGIVRLLGYGSREGGGGLTRIGA